MEVGRKDPGYSSICIIYDDLSSFSEKDVTYCALNLCVQMWTKLSGIGYKKQFKVAVNTGKKFSFLREQSPNYLIIGVVNYYYFMTYVYSCDDLATWQLL